MVIISGFPAVGKSYMFNNLKGKKVADSDSSLFSWKYVDGEKVRNEDFPKNYIEHIKSLKDYDYVLVSTHKSVREALEKESIPYMLVYPSKDLKEEYIQRYKERGSNEAFIKLMDENWDKFLSELEEETFPTKLELKNGETLMKLFELEII